MGLRISTNLQSLKAQSGLREAEDLKQNSLSKLSSGQRINKASDDAAGLSISEKLKSSIRSMGQAVRNVGDGISMIQTAEGGMNEISNLLIRLKELSIQAGTDTLGEEERKYTDLEFQNLAKEIDRISNSTEFNGIKLLSGKEDELDFQIGIHNSKTEDRIKFSTKEAEVSLQSLGLDDLSVVTKYNARENLNKIDTAITMVSNNRAVLGAYQNRMTSVIANLENSSQNLSEANSRIRDADMAVESANLSKGNILSASATSVLAQANNAGSAALKLI